MSGPKDIGPVHRAAERVARESYGRILAFLAARTGDVAGAEDALAEAIAQALGQWPRDGMPANPEGWLVTVARRRQVDIRRHEAIAEAGAPRIRLIAEEIEALAMTPSDIPDRRLALMLACAHPGIEARMHTPLMLQTILGLSADQIGAAYLVPGKAMGQRLVRAKAHIRAQELGLETVSAERMSERLAPVVDAIYAAYGRDWAALDDPALSDEALWLARLAVALVPDAPEVKGLLALLLFLQARRRARRDAEGGYVPLEDQDPADWDWTLIDAAEELLAAANAEGPSGRYQIEAAIQSAHCARRFGGSADWPSILRLYDALSKVTPGPVVALNRAAARAYVEGPEPGLAELEALQSDRRMVQYQPFWATKAHLCALAGRKQDAMEAYAVAAGLSQDVAVRAFLMQRLGHLRDG